MGADVSTPTPPPGFVLDAQPSAPAPPPGFVLDTDLAAYSPTSGMSSGELALAGVGGGMLDAGQGAEQLMSHLAHSPAGAGFLAMLNPGLAAAGAGIDPSMADARAKEKAQTDKPLNDTSPGFWGNLVGRAAATLPATLGGGGIPATIGGVVRMGAAQGGLSALANPVTSDNYSLDKTKDVGISAVAGGLTMGALKGLGLTVGAVKGLAGKLKDALPNATQAAREQAAAQLIRDAAANPATLEKPAEQFVAGSMPTTAEATRDIGLSGLQRTLQSMSPEFNTEVTRLAQGNNAARVEALRGAFGGADEASAKAIEAARDKAAAPLLEAAKKTTGVQIAPVIKLADQIIKARQGNRAVSGVVQEIRDNIANTGRIDVAGLHNVRQDINNLLAGKVAGGGDAAKAASRELLTLRTALDQQISKAEPKFRQFLKEYAAMSREADKVRVGSELLGKSAASLGADGSPVLSAAQFARAANDLDQTVRTATGFKKATADSVLSPEQRSMVGAVRSDLDRTAGIAQGKAIGSDTMQKAFGSAKVGEQLGMADFLTANPARIFDNVKRYYGNKTLDVVKQAMLNPSEAERLVAKLPKAQQAAAAQMLSDSRILQALKAASGGSGAFVGQAASAVLRGQ